MKLAQIKRIHHKEPEVDALHFWLETDVGGGLLLFRREYHPFLYSILEDNIGGDLSISLITFASSQFMVLTLTGADERNGNWMWDVELRYEKEKTGKLYMMLYRCLEPRVDALV